MTLRSKEIARLVSLTEATYAADRAKMMSLSQSEATLRAQIQELSLSRSDFGQTADEHMIAQSEANFLWLNWVDKSIRSLHESLARILVEKSRLNGKLAHSFGRNQVMQKLLDRSKASEDKRRTLRQEDSTL